jgi:hypothetical protein
VRLKLPARPATEVWPDHVAVIDVAVRLMSQLVLGPRGPIGWRYEVLPMLFELLGIDPARRLEVFDGLRVVEVEVMQALRGRSNA